MNNVINFDEYKNLMDIFTNAKSKIDAAKKLNIPTNINGTSLNKKLSVYADKINFNLNSLVKGTDEYKERVYYNKPKTCKECGKILPYEKRNNEFCSQSHATKYNNKQRPPKSKEEKKHISRSLYKYHGWTDEEIDKIESGELKITRKNKEKICPTCHKLFLGKLNQIYCSIKCVHNSPDYIENLRQKQLKNVENGTHKGWATRPLNSYAEKYWMNILDNHNIKYIREDHSNKKYFLDFLIEKNGVIIDLEIDGKQHKNPDRVIHDKERDEFLSNLGIIIYRVDWNSVNSENGKKEMHKKIKDFLTFYESIK